MDNVSRVKKLLRNALNLGDRADRMSAETRLLGELPEFDSIAVVTVVTAIEEEFGVSIDDDELSADAFATVGSLADLLARKLAA